MFLAANQFGEDRYESVDGETFVNVFDIATREQLERRGYNIWTWDSRRSEWSI